ncbi:hypothetical protein [Comamonas thiooxydans]|uniref:hypothetical protein n=2 Tax=Comamonas thiooxydans TaxID=363952 RepID=UPI000F4E601B|nr:hypothetical protein [Comamonas thiooxydans]MDO1474453.1 hypothetical protein [Comamonas thiooxydans]
MKFKRVLREALRFWPSRMAISAGKLVAGGGGLFPQLSGLLELAQAYAKAWSEAHQLMVWEGFCALHKDAVTSVKAGQGGITKSDLDMRYLRQKYQQSLFASGSHYPRQMLRAYRHELESRSGSRQSLKPAQIGKLSLVARLQH